MGWSYRYRADDQLYADDEHGPTVFDPGAPISGGSGNVVSVGIPLLNQVALWTDATHIAGSTTIPAAAHPAHTGDVTSPVGSVVLTYANAMPASKGGLPTGGAGGQVLSKIDGTSYNTQWITAGGNVSNTGTPTANQLALWTDANHVQGITLLPAANHPALTGDVTLVAGTLATTYNNAVPPAKAGLPTGGSTGQVLSKIDSTNYNTSWINPPATGGNVSNTGSPQAAQLALWTDATHIQGVAVLPAINSPILTGDVTSPSGTAATTYNNPVPAAKAGVPTGGTTDQVLRKTSGADYAVGWVTPAAGGGGSGEIAAGPSTIQAALATAVAGDTVRLAAGVFDMTSLGNAGYLLLPDNVNLVGHGPELTIIKSQRDCFTTPGVGILAPGSNCIIQDLAIVGVSATGNGNENTNPLSARGSVGFTKNYDNATYRNCYLKGINDIIICVGASLGHTIFENCTLEGQCDLIMWQCQKNLIMRGCNLIHTTHPSHPDIGQTILLMGDDNGSIKLYNCRIISRGAFNGTFNAIYALENVGTNAFIEAYDVVLDYQSNIPSGSFDIQNFGAGSKTFLLSNVTRTDGLPLVVDTGFTIPVNSAKNTLLSVTVAMLPSNPGVGDEAWVTNGAASLAYNATVTAGGTSKYKVMWNGTNWVVLGGGTMAAGGADVNYVHNQVSPSASWAVTHNLGKFPSVSVVDSGNSVIVPDILYTNTNQLTVSFGSATSGKAYLN